MRVPEPSLSSGVRLINVMRGDNESLQLIEPENKAAGQPDVCVCVCVCVRARALCVVTTESTRVCRCRQMSLSVIVESVRGKVE